MAFSEDRGNVGETLYMTAGSWLTAVDMSTFTSRDIGQDAGTPLALWAGAYGSAAPLLTGTGAGDLFVATSFLTPPAPCVADIDAGVLPPPRSKCKPQSQQPPLPPTAKIGRIDKSSGSVTTAWSVTTSLLPPVPLQLQLQGFAAWGEEFYLFAAQLSGSVVLRFRTSDQSTVEVAQTDATVLTVGVSTCAPLP
jgi:hypothetical protein